MPDAAPQPEITSENSSTATNSKGEPTETKAAAHLPEGWERSPNDEFLPYYLHAMSGVRVHTLVEIEVLSTLPHTEGKKADLPQRDNWRVENDENNSDYSQYVHESTGTLARTATQAQALDALYQRAPNLLKALQDLHHQQQGLKALQRKNGETVTKDFTAALTKLKEMAVQLAEIPEEVLVQTKVELPIKPKANQPKAKTVLKMLFALLAGASLGLLLVATSPAVLATFMNVAILMTLTGTATSIGAFAMAAVAGVIVIGILAMTGLVIASLIKSRLAKPIKQAVTGNEKFSPITLPIEQAKGAENNFDPTATTAALELPRQPERANAPQLTQEAQEGLGREDPNPLPSELMQQDEAEAAPVTLENSSEGDAKINALELVTQEVQIIPQPENSNGGDPITLETTPTFPVIAKDSNAIKQSDGKSIIPKIESQKTEFGAGNTFLTHALATEMFPLRATEPKPQKELEPFPSPNDRVRSSSFVNLTSVTAEMPLPDASNSQKTIIWKNEENDATPSAVVFHTKP